MNWQPIETAPRDGTEILVFRPTEFFVASYVLNKDYFNGRDWEVSDGKHSYRIRYAGLTHWMPLPAPPEVKP